MAAPRYHGSRSCGHLEEAMTRPVANDRPLHLLLIDEVSKGLDDVAAGRVKDARCALQALKRHRSP